MGFSAAPTVTIDPARVIPPDSSAGLHPGEAGPLAPEIRFLCGIVSDPVLREAERAAQRIGVTAEAVLLAEGAISSEHYYRQLARFLGVPFAERPLRPAAAASIDDVLRTGIATLRANAQGWRFIAAPRGENLRRLLQMFEHHRRPQASLLVMTSPERLEALVRHDRRRQVVDTASHGLPEWNAALSARAGVTLPQAMALLTLAVVFCTAAWLAPVVSLVVVEGLFSVAFLMAVVLRFAATAASPVPRIARRSSISDADLPVYTLIVPLYREARVVRRLTAALDRLDYPRAKLDIMLVVEASDTATLAMLDRLHLPARYRVIVAPSGRPRTKPRALNVALQFARGSLVVIYDAEDEPEPGQLRAAVARFAEDPHLTCLQARLAIDNYKDSWLTALFALEYAALFHVINPGLAALGLPIPLGGTSNHFRTEALRRVNGWDAWNVTEDIDLGIRLARFGLRVGSLDSTTFEEAPNTLDAWLKQRCRWMKGWMVTLGTHSREPTRLYRDLGLVPTLAVVAMLFGTIGSCLLGPFCVMLLSIRAWTGNLFWIRTPLDMALMAVSMALLGFGLAGAVWPIIRGLSRRGLLELAPWLILFPVYLVLLCVATWQAAFEVFGRPHSWAKTEHGRARSRAGAESPNSA